MYATRLWSVRHSRFLEGLYERFESTLMGLARVIDRIGYGRLETPVAFIERQVKGFLFDCRMCGRCVLSATGMSCPMNCPKQLRNGPCGGVRADGGCEVLPDMRCVWVEAVRGAGRMRSGGNIMAVQPPLPGSLQGTSSWLRVLREKSGPQTRETVTTPDAV